MMMRFSALAVPLVIASCGPAAGTACPLRVATPAALEHAFACAPAGATIELDPAPYGELRLADRNRGTLLLRSADAKRPATFTSLAIASSSGIHLADLRFSGRPGRQSYGLLVSGSREMQVDRTEFAGPGTAGETRPIIALMLRDSTDLAVRNSRFSGYKHGIALLNVQRTIIADNRFSDLQTDGVRGGGASDLLVERNQFTNFRPAPKDHPDGIQLWSTNQTQPARNITIRNNLVYRGEGAATQGVFIRDTFSKLPFENITISGNLVIGGLFNGIAVSGVAGAKLSENTVVPYPDHDSRIRLEAAFDTDLVGNAAGRFVLRGEIRKRDNLVIKPDNQPDRMIHEWRTRRGLTP